MTKVLLAGDSLALGLAAPLRSATASSFAVTGGWLREQEVQQADLLADEAWQ